MPLPDVWIVRNRPGGPESRGAEEQALFIAAATTKIRPVVTVSLADGRPSGTGPQTVRTTRITDAGGVDREVAFAIEVTRPVVDGVHTAHPHVQITLHEPRTADPATDGFQTAIEGFLRSEGFAGALLETVPGCGRGVGRARRPQVNSLIAVQNLMVLPTARWDLPIGPRGGNVEIADLVFHIPQGAAGQPNGTSVWATPEGTSLGEQIEAYAGRRSHRQSFLCFSEYTKRVAIGLGVPPTAILRFPVALPPGRVNPMQRSLDLDARGERIAWIGPAAADEKGLAFLVDALELVNARLQGTERHVSLDVYGRVPEAGREPAFDRLRAEKYAPLERDGSLAFHGFLNDDARTAMLATRDLLTVNASVPSCEGLGMASVEALIAAGTGYVTRPGGGAEEAARVFFNDGEAFVAAADTREALAGAILAAVDAERHRLRSGGPAWRHRVRDGALFSFDDVVATIDTFRRSLGHEGPGSARAIA